MVDKFEGVGVRGAARPYPKPAPWQQVLHAEVVVTFEGVTGAGRPAPNPTPWPQALHAEVVVTFEGVTEAGALFSAKRSYLPSEIHWGYVFAPIVHPAPAGLTQHTVDLSRRAPRRLTPPPVTRMQRRAMRGWQCRGPLARLGQSAGGAAPRPAASAWLCCGPCPCAHRHPAPARRRPPAHACRRACGQQNRALERVQHATIKGITCASPHTDVCAHTGDPQAGVRKP